MNWKPIDTAPKDGTPILVIAVEDHLKTSNIPAVARFVRDKWRTIDEGGDHYSYWPLTHWMELPTAPNQKPYHNNQ